MLSGKEFRILRATLAVELIDGKRTAITVPEGSIIRVLSRPTRVNPLVDVYWGSRKVEMFAVDVRNRSAQIERAAGA
jgi:hypothetical protein